MFFDSDHSFFVRCLEPQEALRLNKNCESKESFNMKFQIFLFSIFLILLLFAGSNNLIQIYCSKCQTVPSNVTASYCCTCQSLLQFQCMNCFKVFESRTMVEKHIKLECKSESVYQCLTCDFGTNYKSTYERHIKRHIFERNALYSSKKNKTNKLKKKTTPLTGKTKSGISCPYCQKKTKSDKILTAHLFQKHQDCLPEDYKCHICGKKYNTSMSLMGHLTRLHKGGLNNKNVLRQKNLYECDRCSIKIGTKRDLTKHLKECAQ